jgi:hypothetical protein
MSGDGLFSALSTLVDQGAGLLVGTSDADGVPRATRGWGVRRDDNGAVRVVVSADDPLVVSNLTGSIAVTAAEVRTLSSAQLKGRIVGVVEPDPTDREFVERQTTSFFDWVVAIDGNELELLQRLVPTRMLTVLIDVTDGFDQTPGPSAGSVLEDVR